MYRNLNNFCPIHRNILVVIFVFLLQVPFVYGQFKKTYGESNNSLITAFSARTTSDGGSIVGGNYNAVNVMDVLNSPSVFLEKVDGTGNVSWFKTYSYPDYFVTMRQVEQAPDGSFYALAHTPQDGSAGLALLLKTDSNGNLLWQLPIKSATSVMTRPSFYLESDGTIRLCCSNEMGSGVALHQIDSNGNVLNSALYEGNYQGGPVAPSGDGGSLLALSSGGNNIHILRVDATGQVVWTKTIANVTGSLTLGAHSIKRLSDGNFMLFASGATGALSGGAPVLYEFDANGNVVKDGVISNASQDETYQLSYFMEPYITDFGDILLPLWVFSNTSQTYEARMALYKRSNFTATWAKTVKSGDHEQELYFASTQSGGYYTFAGVNFLNFSAPFSYTDTELLIMKLDGNLNAGSCTFDDGLARAFEPKGSSSTAIVVNAVATSAELLATATTSAGLSLTARNLCGSTTCGTPLAVTLRTITPTTVRVSWTDTSSKNQIRYGIGNNYNNYTYLIRNNDFVTLHNLQPNTSYNVQVRGICAVGDTSNWTNALTFSTACPAPTNLVVSNISYTSATISWTTTSNQKRFFWRIQGNSGWDSVSVNGNNNTKVLNNLQQGTNYEVAVKSKCNGNKWSGLSNILVIATLRCDAPTEVMAVFMTATTAKVSWTHNPAATLYQIRYRKESEANIWTTLSSTSDSVLISNVHDTIAYVAQVRSRCGLIWGNWGTDVPMVPEKGFSDCLGWERLNNIQNICRFDSASIQVHYSLTVNQFGCSQAGINYFTYPLNVTLGGFGTNLLQSASIFDWNNQLLLPVNINPYNNPNQALPPQWTTTHTGLVIQNNQLTVQLPSQQTTNPFSTISYDFVLTFWVPVVDYNTLINISLVTITELLQQGNCTIIAENIPNTEPVTNNPMCPFNGAAGANISFPNNPDQQINNYSYDILDLPDDNVFPTNSTICEGETLYYNYPTIYVPQLIAGNVIIIPIDNNTIGITAAAGGGQAIVNYPYTLMLTNPITGC